MRTTKFFSTDILNPIRKKLAVVLIILVCSLCTSFSRDCYTLGGYTYNTWSEFYEYMNNAASYYNRMSIELRDYSYSYNEELKSFTSSFGDTGFEYSNGKKTLKAFFLNSQLRKENGIGNLRWFDLPQEYNSAVSYWNRLLNAM